MMATYTTSLWGLRLYMAQKAEEAAGQGVVLLIHNGGHHYARIWEQWVSGPTPCANHLKRGLEAALAWEELQRALLDTVPDEAVLGRT